MNDMSLRVVSGTSSVQLVSGVAAALPGVTEVCEVVRFPDGELRPVVADVRGHDVYVVQSTGPPVGESIVELMLLLDACRRAGAARVTAVVPYFGYARQDRRGRSGEAVAARVVADALVSSGAQRLVVVDPHTAALEAMCSVPLEVVSAVPRMADALRDAVTARSVIVAPDFGAHKLAERYAAELGCPVVIVRKSRVSGEVVRAEGLVGDVDGCSVIIVDDMITTGGTIDAAMRLLQAHGAAGGAIVAASHGLLVGSAGERLAAAGVSRVLVTDSLTPVEHPGLAVQVRSIAGLLADAIGRLHRNEDLGQLGTIGPGSGGSTGGP